MARTKSIIYAITATALVASGGMSTAFAGGEVDVYYYRQPELTQPILGAFTKETGIEANVLFLDKGLMERIRAEGVNSPADILLTVDIA